MASNEYSPTARASMLVRRPVSEVFNAIVAPDVLTQFWLASTSGPLEKGKWVHWEFMVPDASVETFVEELEQDKRIRLQWSDGTVVEWEFEPRPDDSTRVAVKNAGFKGDAKQVTEAVLEATQGFAIVLCDLKTVLEGRRSANLVRDKAQLIEEALAAHAS